MKIANPVREDAPKIDKGIPLPMAWGGSGRVARWPLQVMEPGDSFFVPNKGPENLSGSVNYARARNKGWRYSMRVVTEQGVKGVRIWRTA